MNEQNSARMSKAVLEEQNNKRISEPLVNENILRAGKADDIKMSAAERCKILIEIGIGYINAFRVSDFCVTLGA